MTVPGSKNPCGSILAPPPCVRGLNTDVMGAACFALLRLYKCSSEDQKSFCGTMLWVRPASLY